MKTLVCRNCGAPVVALDSMAQAVLDRINDAGDRAKRGPRRYRLAALQEAAEYRSIYKSLMHNVTQKEYADVTAPAILRVLTDEIRARNLLSEAEIDALYAAGRERAKAKSEAAKREIERIYGRFETMSNKGGADPTADAAISRIDGMR